jgi:hypothetical protein
MAWVVLVGALSVCHAVTTSCIGASFTIENVRLKMTEIKCAMCEEPATWIRHTQFAGSHPFCEEHAKLEADFYDSDSYLDWEELTDERDGT